jgi:ABC-2 type transport system permease protein
VTGLLKAEVRRITARRLVRVLGALALLAVLLVEGRAFLVSNRDLAAARRRAERIVADSAPSGQRLADICESMKAGDAIPPETDCTSAEGQQLVREQFGPADPSQVYVDPRLSARRELPKGARAVAVAVALMGFLVGASYIGAEWHHGTMQALLFWEPRRWRVLLAKALALVGVVMAFALALQVVVFGLTWLTAATRGTTAGLTGGLVTSVVLTALRGLAVVSVTSLLGYGVAGLARVTAAALGGAFVYFAIVENLVRGLRPGWQRFLFSENVSAVLLKHIPVAQAHQRLSFEGLITSYRLTGVRGVVTLAVYLGLLLGAFAVTFVRRDVT